MNDFQSQLLAAAQASGMVSDADDAPAADSASVEPELETGADDGLARDEDDTALADDGDDDDLGLADDETDEPSEREAELLRQLQALQDQQTRYEAERLAAEQERQQAAWAQAEVGLDTWLRRSTATLQQRAIRDEQIAQESADPQTMRNHLAALRQRDEEWVWSQYRTQKQVYEQHKTGALMTALAQTRIREWAEQTAQRYGLTKESAGDLMRYPDGTPVHPDAMPARAAELAEQRRRERNLKRQLSQAKRSQAADALRATTGIAPGGGQPRSVPEFKSWREEMQWAANELGIGR